MCQNIAVKTVVDGFVAKGFMFTAFDVTKFLRSSGTQVYHRDVNKAVQEMFRHGEMPDYEKDTVDVGAPVAPFVYYHRNGDANNYQADWLENNPDQTGMLNDASSPAGIAQPSPSTYGSAPVSPVTPVSPIAVKTPVLPKGVIATDKEGRLYIAPVITQAAGLHPMQTVWVVQDNGKLVMKTASQPSAWPYMVNSDGRIRVCRSLLSKIANSSGANFKVSAASGNIEIVQA